MAETFADVEVTGSLVVRGGVTVEGEHGYALSVSALPHRGFGLVLRDKHGEASTWGVLPDGAVLTFTADGTDRVKLGVTDRDRDEDGDATAALVIADADGAPVHHLSSDGDTHGDAIQPCAASVKGWQERQAAEEAAEADKAAPESADST
jgi:hypothetical protein